ncbi:hypothetical protein J6590_085396 [Homalodisca vitripennis]|nr:hypothetical protein J6590_085396 [Homalodisca vitripennis]
MNAQVRPITYNCTATCSISASHNVNAAESLATNSHNIVSPYIGSPTIIFRFV